MASLATNASLYQAVALRAALQLQSNLALCSWANHHFKSFLPNRTNVGWKRARQTSESRGESQAVQQNLRDVAPIRESLSNCKCFRGRIPVAWLNRYRQNVPALEANFQRNIAMKRSTTMPSLRLLLGVVVFALLWVTSSTASASCGDYLQHRSNALTSPASQPFAVDSLASVGNDAPLSYSDDSNSIPPSHHCRCRGMNCSKGYPQAPIVPQRVQWQRQNQWCVLAIASIAADSAMDGEAFPPESDSQPIHRTFRLDRPPQLG